MYGGIDAEVFAHKHRLEERLGVSAVHAAVVARGQKNYMRLFGSNVVGDELGYAGSRIGLDNIVTNRHGMRNKRVNALNRFLANIKGTRNKGTRNKGTRRSLMIPYYSDLL